MRIFVHIAAYRDPEITATVFDALSKAKYPQNLSFGIVWQADPQQDESYVASLRTLSEVSILDVDYRSSQGACWARSEVLKLHREEPYIFQLDSHMRFAPHWDEQCLRWCDLELPRHSLITHYAPPFDPPDTFPDPSPRNMVLWTQNGPFGTDGLPRFVYHADQSAYTEPQPTCFLSGHMLFGAANFWYQVPYDPHIYFDGEEISLAVRAWTHGYNLYCPNRTVVYHEYSRRQRTKHWDDNETWWQRQRDGKERVKRLLQYTPNQDDFGPYGLGSIRTLNDYQLLAGLNFQQQTYNEKALDGVPF